MIIYKTYYRYYPVNTSCFSKIIDAKNSLICIFHESYKLDFDSFCNKVIESHAMFIIVIQANLINRIAWILLKTIQITFSFSMFTTCRFCLNVLPIHSL